MNEPISAYQKTYINNYRRRRKLVAFCQIFILAIFITLWEGSTQLGLLNDFIFSSPSRIIKTFAAMAGNGMVFYHIGITLFETFLSFFIVLTAGILLSVLLWWNRSISAVLEPYLITLNSLPKTALAPIFIVWLGNNMKTIIITAISVAIFGSILNLFTSFQTTDPDKLKLIYTLHGNRFDCLTKVILPINFPAILSILKVDIGLCLIGVVIGEFLAARKGLGYLIIYGSQVFKMDWVMLSIVLLCLIAALLYGILNRLEKHFINS